jgi:cytochrome P450
MTNGGRQIVDERPVFDSFDPLDPSQRGDPYPVLAQARASRPVFWMPEYNVWCITRHEDVFTVLRDPETYSSIVMSGEQADPPPQYADALPHGYPSRVSFVGMDPPEHTRLRRLAQRAFTPRILRQHEDDIRATAGALVDEFGGRDEFDLITDFGARYPALVITGMFGVAIKDHEQYERWTEASLAVTFAPPGGYDEPEEAELARAATMVELDQYLTEMIAQARAGDEDGFLPTVIRGEAGEDAPLTTAEIKGTLCLLLLAGTHTTSNLVANMMLTLLGARERWEAVKRDPESVAPVVEEVLRLCGPSRAVYRRVTRDVELGGVCIPAGDSLYVNIASANHDEQVFERPEDYVVGRPNIRDHVAFSRWTHFCMGAPLARLMGTIALETFIERLPDMDLVPGQELEWTPNAIQPKLLSALVRTR